MLECTGNGRDSGIDQIVPTCVVGTDYVVSRGIDSRNPSPFNYATIVAITANTQVFIDGNPAPVATLVNPGDYYNYLLPNPNNSSHLIQTSLPAYVYQFGSVENNGELGMALAAPIDGCRGDTFVEFLEFPGSTTNTATVIIPNTGLATLELNGSPYTNFSTAVPVPGLPGFSTVFFDASDLLAFNVLRSDEFFTASHFVGNRGGGTFGYLTSFKDEIEIFDPVTDLPTFEYFVDTICGGQAMEHCIDAVSCSGGNFVGNILQSDNTGGLRIFPNSLCYEYTGLDGYTGQDEITVQLSDAIGFTQPVCLTYFVCGSSPTISCPTGLDGVCDISEIAPYADFDAFMAAGGSADDDCNLDPSTFRLVSEVSNSQTCPEIITRTYGISDECGNETTCTQEITLMDDEDPKGEDVNQEFAVCSADEVPPLGNYQAYLDAGGSAIDNCEIDPLEFELINTESMGMCAETVTRTYVIRDLCGNSSTVQQAIIVDDNEDPIISCPNLILATCSIDERPPYSTLAEFNSAGGNVSDNCRIDDASFSFISEESNNVMCPEIISRIYEIRDECGNSARCTQEIRIQDNERPSISCPPLVERICELGDVPPYETMADFIAAGGSISDNCALDESSFELLGEANGKCCL